MDERPLNDTLKRSCRRRFDPSISAIKDVRSSSKYSSNVWRSCEFRRHRPIKHVPHPVHPVMPKVNVLGREFVRTCVRKRKRCMNCGFKWGENEGTLGAPFFF